MRKYGIVPIYHNSSMTMIMMLSLGLLPLGALLSAADAFTSSYSPSYHPPHKKRQPSYIRFSFLEELFKTTKITPKENDTPETKTTLLSLLSKVPPNEPTPVDLTAEILQAVKNLEESCPTPEEDVLQAVAGNWELLWTAQDVSSLPQK
jgi:hypothetical protein